MLYLVRDKSRTRPPEPFPAWPRAPHEESHVSYTEPDLEDFRPEPRRRQAEHRPPPRDRDRARRRPKRRSGVLAFLLTFLFALALGAVIGGGFLAYNAGLLDTTIAAFQGKPAPVVADSPPAAPAAVPAPAAAAPVPAPPQPPQQAVAAGPRLPPMPDAPTMMMLVRNTVTAIHSANLTGNYSVVRDLAAPAFQQANSAARLSAAFAELAGRGLDLSQILVVAPALMREPAIDPDGRLRIVGAFPADGQQVNFEMVFQLVGGRWRLYGLGMDAPGTPAGEAPAKPVAGAIPDGPHLAALIRTAVLTLNQANITGNYSVLLDSGAPGFREANTVAKLAAAFAALRERNLDLSPVGVIDPKLFRPPAIDKQGYLRLTGFFPSAPEQVNFDLAFAFSNGAWRLFGIGVNTSREVAQPQAEQQQGAPAGVRNVSPVAQQPQAGPQPEPAAVQPARTGASATAPVPRLRPPRANE